MTFAGRLLALREGRVSFADFYAATRSLWFYMGGRLLRARNPGLGVGEEDVAQEMVLECWRCVGCSYMAADRLRLLGAAPG